MAVVGALRASVVTANEQQQQQQQQWATFSEPVQPASLHGVFESHFFSSFKLRRKSWLDQQTREHCVYEHVYIEQKDEIKTKKKKT
jgi:hypothetical protein